MTNAATTTYYTANIVTKGKDGKNRFHRVGALFENTNRNTGEIYFTLKTDFPVIVNEELVFFAPKPKSDDDAVTD